MRDMLLHVLLELAEPSLKLMWGIVLSTKNILERAAQATPRPGNSTHCTKRFPSASGKHWLQ